MKKRKWLKWGLSGIFATAIAVSLPIAIVSCSSTATTNNSTKKDQTPNNSTKKEKTPQQKTENKNSDQNNQPVNKPNKEQQPSSDNSAISQGGTWNNLTVSNYLPIIKNLNLSSTTNLTSLTNTIIQNQLVSKNISALNISISEDSSIDSGTLILTLNGKYTSGNHNYEIHDQQVTITGFSVSNIENSLTIKTATINPNYWFENYLSIKDISKSSYNLEENLSNIFSSLVFSDKTNSSLSYEQLKNLSNYKNLEISINQDGQLQVKYDVTSEMVFSSTKDKWIEKNNQNVIVTTNLVLPSISELISYLEANMTHAYNVKNDSEYNTLLASAFIDQTKENTSLSSKLLTTILSSRSINLTKLKQANDISSSIVLSSPNDNVGSLELKLNLSSNLNLQGSSIKSLSITVSGFKTWAEATQGIISYVGTTPQDSSKVNKLKILIKSSDFNDNNQYTGTQVFLQQIMSLITPFFPNYGQKDKVLNVYSNTTEDESNILNKLEKNKALQEIIIDNNIIYEKQTTSNPFNGTLTIETNEIQTTNISFKINDSKNISITKQNNLLHINVPIIFTITDNYNQHLTLDSELKFTISQFFNAN